MANAGRNVKNNGPAGSSPEILWKNNMMRQAYFVQYPRCKLKSPRQFDSFSIFRQFLDSSADQAGHLCTQRMTDNMQMLSIQKSVVELTEYDGAKYTTNLKANIATQ